MGKRGQSGGDDWVQPNTHMGVEEQTMVLRYLKEGLTQSQIAEKLGRTQSAISRFVKRYFGTTELAEQYIRSKALNIAKKIVKHATVEESIEILSRPNIGVLAPVKTVDSGPRILISVGQDSIGAIESGQRQHLGLTDGSSRAIMGSGSHDAQREIFPPIAADAQEREARPQNDQVVHRPPCSVAGTVSDDSSAPSGGSDALANPVDAARTGQRKRVTHLRAVGPPIENKEKSRVAIPGRVKGRARGSTGIHLRYDIVESESPKGDIVGKEDE